MAFDENKVSAFVREEVFKSSSQYKGASIEIYYKDLEMVRNIEKIGKDINLELVYPQNSRLVGNIVLSVNVYSKRKLMCRVDIPVQIKVFSNVLCSSKNVSKGVVIDKNNTVLINKDLSKLPFSVIMETNEAFGKETVTFLPKGVVFQNWMVREVPLIKKGAIIRLVKRSGNVLAEVKAISISDGYPDKIFKARNMYSKKVVEAMPINSIEAEVR